MQSFSEVMLRNFSSFIPWLGRFAVEVVSTGLWPEHHPGVSAVKNRFVLNPRIWRNDR